MQHGNDLNRREFLGMATAIGAGLMTPGSGYAAAEPTRKIITKSNEAIPIIGLGTSRTFDAAGDAEGMARLLQVLQAFFELGGGMIDSSPMYGSAQEVIGQLLPQVSVEKNLFAATKVWVNGRENGIAQMRESRRLWGIRAFDLMQIHNLVDWRIHLETLQRMKAEKAIRYLGITTSHGRFHEELKGILKKHEFDFVQLSYNIGNRDVEAELLPVARERGIAVIVNRPYQRGSLFRQVRGRPLPPWAQDFDCHSWGQFFLKFVASHPAVTCVIPATSKVKHLRDNMQAGRGRLPTASQRAQMIDYFEAL